MESGTTLRRRLFFWAWLAACALLLAAFEVSLNHGICYARGPFFFVLTDGYIAIPFPDGQPRTWGDWGWWVWQPWRDPPHPFGEIIPWISTSRDVAAMALHIPLRGCLAVLVAIAMFRAIERAPQWLLASVAVIGALFYILVVLAECRPLPVNPTLPKLVWPLVPLTPLVWVPATWVFARKWLISRRIPWNRCRVCRYDLRGNVSGRCPECGTVIIIPLHSLSPDRMGLDNSTGARDL